MKKIGTLLLLNLGFISIIYSQCSPDLKEIYSFDIGDIFQYITEINDWSTGGEPETKIIYEKKTVLEKNIVNDSIFYVFDCKYYSYYKAPSNAPVDKYGEYFASFNDTLFLKDSSSHYLNACDSQLVYISINYDFYSLNKDFYSVIFTSEKDGLLEKKVGGFENLFQYDSNDSLVIVYEYEYEQKFVEGLGLKSQSEFIFEYSKDLELQGYVKNGDTTGIIWDDNDFVVSIEEKTNVDNIIIYPTLIPENGVINIDSRKKFKIIKIYSIDGNPQNFKKISQNQIQLFSKKNGVYILTIVVDNRIITRRLIKR